MYIYVYIYSTPRKKIHKLHIPFRKSKLSSQQEKITNFTLSYILSHRPQSTLPIFLTI